MAKLKITPHPVDPGAHLTKEAHALATRPATRSQAGFMTADQYNASTRQDFVSGPFDAGYKGQWCIMDNVYVERGDDKWLALFLETGWGISSSSSDSSDSSSSSYGLSESSDTSDSSLSSTSSSSSSSSESSSSESSSSFSSLSSLSSDSSSSSRSSSSSSSSSNSSSSSSSNSSSSDSSSSDSSLSSLSSRSSNSSSSLSSSSSSSSSSSNSSSSSSSNSSSSSSFIEFSSSSNSSSSSSPSSSNSSQSVVDNSSSSSSSSSSSMIELSSSSDSSSSSSDSSSSDSSSSSEMENGYIEASGAGTTACNGNYLVEGTYNGKVCYKHETQTLYIYWQSPSWRLGTTKGGSVSTIRYSVSNSDNYPPRTGWSTNTGYAVGPAPTLAYIVNSSSSSSSSNNSSSSSSSSNNSSSSSSNSSSSSSFIEFSSSSNSSSSISDNSSSSSSSSNSSSSSSSNSSSSSSSSSSESGVSADYTVSGAGYTSANGNYYYYDTYNGKPRYKETGVTNYIYWDSGDSQWKINSDSTDYYWHTSDTGATPPLSGWSYGIPGTDPAPTLTEGDNNSSSSSSSNSSSSNSSSSSSSSSNSSSSSSSVDDLGKYALSLNGSTHITFGTDNTFNPSDAMTVEAWIKTSSTSGTIMSRIPGTGGSTDGHWWFQLSSGKLYAGFYQGGWIEIYSTNTVNDNTWHHVAFAWDKSDDSGNLKLYIDGSDNTSGSTTLTSSRSSVSRDCRVGSYSDSSSYLTGVVDEVRFWNVKRTGTQINNAKGAELSPSYPSGLVGYWKINEGTGTNVNDYVGSHDGTVSGTATWVSGWNA